MSAKLIRRDSKLYLRYFVSEKYQKWNMKNCSVGCVSLGGTEFNYKSPETLSASFSLINQQIK